MQPVVTEVTVVTKVTIVTEIIHSKKTRKDKELWQDRKRPLSAV